MGGLKRCFFIDTNRSKYKNSSIGDEQFKQIEIDLAKLLEEDKLYLDQSLSMSDLANRLTYNSSQLSQFFSQYKDVSFYDFINSYRIKEFVNRIESKDYQQYKIESIANDSGFKNKAVFYKYFKTHLNMTPKQYLSEFQ